VTELLPGQYQIGGITIGRHTNVVVENFDAKPYEVNAQDYQLPRSDEIRFGFDHFKPTSVEIQMQVIYNYQLPPFENIALPDFWINAVTVEDLASVWRGDSVRSQWGAMMPLYFCDRSGITKIIYGRPGSFASEKVSEKSTLVKCVGEFRRADTLTYDVEEETISLTTGQSKLLTNNTNEYAWVRIVGSNGASNPTLNFGGIHISVNLTLTTGQSFEISSYPWQRRAILSDGTNIRNLISNTAADDNILYLDQLYVPPQTSLTLSYTSGGGTMYVITQGATTGVI